MWEVSFELLNELREELNFVMQTMMGKLYYRANK